MDEEGLSFITRQPETAEEIDALWRAAVACPTQSIGTTEVRRPPEPAFPFELTHGRVRPGAQRPGVVRCALVSWCPGPTGAS